MAVDATAVASVLGIETTYQDFRAGQILYLPQHVAVLAQGNTGVSYTTTKFVATDAASVGSVAGYGSPAHLCMRELFPANGDGVGTVPVTVFLLAEAGGATGASGTITPSGTQTANASYRIVINNIASEPFVASASIALNDLLRVMGNAMTAVPEMPMSYSYTYGTVTAAPGGSNTGDGTLGTLSVAAGQVPKPGAWTLTCTAAATDAGTFRLVDPDGSTVSTTVSVTGSPQTVGGITFTLTDGATDFVVGDLFTITVPATNMTLASKWKGASANALYVEVTGDSLGTTYTIVQPTGGAGNPDLSAALGQMGNVWYTMVLNALNPDDTTALDDLQTVGDGRWGQLVKKPFMAFTGTTEAVVNDAILVPEARKTDKINFYLEEPGSNDLPFIVAAAQLARIAKAANNNPAADFLGLKCPTLTPGLDSVQWTYTQRDQAVKGGCSTIEVVDGVVELGDIVSFYHPTGENPPAWRNAITQVKAMNILYNLELIFAAQEWKTAVLIPDGQATTNPLAKTPSMAKTAANNMITSLGLEAIISDPKTAKSRTTAVINAMNPNRLDVGVKVQLSGNPKIRSIDFFFGFYFGQAVAA